MTPKEKAEELYSKFYRYSFKAKAIECTLIAVDEILNNIDFTSMLNGTDDYNYWLQVKQEIEKL
jgi:hypothetical protein